MLKSKNQAKQGKPKSITVSNAMRIKLITPSSSFFSINELKKKCVKIDEAIDGILQNLMDTDLSNRVISLLSEYREQIMKQESKKSKFLRNGKSLKIEKENRPKTEGRKFFKARSLKKAYFPKVQRFKQSQSNSFFEKEEPKSFCCQISKVQSEDSEKIDEELERIKQQNEELKNELQKIQQEQKGQREQRQIMNTQISHFKDNEKLFIQLIRAYEQKNEFLQGKQK